jgi:hypothetical protein
MNSTIKAYDEGNFVDWRKNKDEERKSKGLPTFWKDEMDIFLSYVNEGNILEIGPGIGIEANYLLSKGDFYSYTGVEPALKLAKYCRKTLSIFYESRIRIVNKSVEEFDTVEKFDAVVAVTSLIHVMCIYPVLVRLREIFDKGAYGWIVMNESSTGKRIIKSPHGYTYYFYEFDEFCSYLEKIGFEVLPESKIVERGGHRWQVYYILAV